MGLISSSTGKRAVDSGLAIEKHADEKVIALAGNPNVGKSTVFNELTGLNQHTGNWPGKTVTNAQGHYTHHGRKYIMVDIPGTYSLMAHSAEEEIARDFICFGEPDAVVVVCDATCLERNMNLVLQTLEITPHVIVCVNLIDEAKKKHITIDFKRLQEHLGVPVIGTSARSCKGLDALMDAVGQVVQGQENAPLSLRYPRVVEETLALVIPAVSKLPIMKIPAKWIALKLISGDTQLITSLNEYLKLDILADESVSSALREARDFLRQQDISMERLRDMIVSSIVLQAEEPCADAVVFEQKGYNNGDRRLDHILTSRSTGIPVMLMLLAAVFWITITGANAPSQLLATGLFWIQDRLSELFLWLGTPAWVGGALVDGVYRVLAWVVAVMLPPMAIFFPMFTLLEDLGYLPRVAFNLDKSFQRCSACGKQALTMCMGLQIMY
ncbi:ferrous iron transporter B [Oscillospiraceae bacterium PP1C4]